MLLILPWMCAKKFGAIDFDQVIALAPDLIFAEEIAGVIARRYHGTEAFRRFLYSHMFYDIQEMNSALQHGEMNDFLYHPVSCRAKSRTIYEAVCPSSESFRNMLIVPSFFIPEFVFDLHLTDSVDFNLMYLRILIGLWPPDAFSDDSAIDDHHLGEDGGFEILVRYFMRSSFGKGILLTIGGDSDL